MGVAEILNKCFKTQTGAYLENNPLGLLSVVVCEIEFE